MLILRINYISFDMALKLAIKPSLLLLMGQNS
jgi:hypothetical protein